MEHSYAINSTLFSPNVLYQKHLRRQALSEKEKAIIINVYCFFRRENPKNAKEEIVERTAAATGISKSTVYRIKSERKNEANQSRAQGKFHRTPRRSRKRKCDEFDECQIRQKIHREFFFKNKLPTLTTLQTSIQEDPGLPTVSRSTLATILRRIGFMYKSRKRNSFLCERPEIQMWRHRYLREIRKHRKANRSIVYTDETWVNAGHTRSKAWQDTRVLSSHQAFLDGLSTGVKQPTGKGSRLIIVDAGTKDGFIPGASLVFQAKKDDGDYHGEMNAASYEKWFREQLLPNIPPNSVIVLDNASYHSAQVELLPRKHWRKDLIREWLTSKDIQWNTDMIKDELLKLVEPLRPKYSDKNVDKMAREAGHEVLRLPPYHCELNPIELVSITINSDIGLCC